MNKRAVIVEDEFFVANHLKKILEKNGYDVVSIFHEGESVLANINSLKDVIFLLDIQLSTNIDGVNIALELKKRSIPFIFITANTESDTFDKAIVTNPTAYVSKPFKEIDVVAAVLLASQKLDVKIAIESGKEKIMIDPNDVLYFKSDNVYVEVYLKNKTYILRKQLKVLESELSQNFQRCHKSYLVNFSKISRIKGNSIYLDDIEIPLSRTYRRNFLNL
ncbi:LytR/AlgR family response regulator transcription factor [Brumimicrobium mesophilum]|uniref:LytR/AlgR family response regulator transcription factor n=1 Tax=Brumimicrobium mesophilum TaxID=392717 RepID=UPI00131DC47B|nr:response regulator transcription factor [Brumimicrobium mesophilum]